MATCKCGDCPGCRRRAYDRQRWRDRPDRRAATAERLRIWREKKQEYVRTYLEAHPCVDCGEADPIVLEFDHRDQSTKLHNVANLITGMGKMAILITEIEKCDVVCANCHRRRTHSRGQYTYRRDVAVMKN